MTLLTDLKELEGACREMDARIWAELNNVRIQWRKDELFYFEKDNDRWQFMGWRDPGKEMQHFSLNTEFESTIDLFTASVDAAMTSVPADCDLLVNFRSNYAKVWEKKETGRDGVWEYDGAPEPSISVVIAALQAMGVE